MTVSRTGHATNALTCCIKSATEALCRSFAVLALPSHCVDEQLAFGLSNCTSSWSKGVLKPCASQKNFNYGKIPGNHFFKNVYLTSIGLSVVSNGWLPSLYGK